MIAASPSPPPNCRGRVMHPQVTYAAQPHEPRGELASGQSVTVSVRVHIDQNGKLLDAQIAQSSHNHAIDLAALEAARRSRYAPGFSDCQAVQNYALLKTTFVNNDVAEDPQERASLKPPAGWNAALHHSLGTRFETVGYWQPPNGTSQHIVLSKTLSGGASLDGFAQWILRNERRLAGAQNVHDDGRIQICNGKQAGWQITMRTDYAGVQILSQEILAVAKTVGFIADYARLPGTAQNMAAIGALRSLCVVSDAQKNR